MDYLFRKLQSHVEDICATSYDLNMSEFEDFDKGNLQEQELNSYFGIPALGQSI